MKPRAYEGTEKYIFISYAHADSEVVFRLIRSLQNDGYRVWYDEGIIPGSEWPENIAMHLNDAAMVLAMITPRSMDSQNCRREINFALSRQKPFLSVILEPTQMSLGMEMQLSAQNLVLRDNYANWEDFIDKIKSCPGLEPCKAEPSTDGEHGRPVRRMDEIVMGNTYGKMPEETPAPKKKKNPLLIVVALLAVCLLGVGAKLFLSGEGPADEAVQNTVQPSLPTPTPYVIPDDVGTLRFDSSWGFGDIKIYAVDEKTMKVYLTDDTLPNGYINSPTPGEKIPYWNVIFNNGADSLFAHLRYESEAYNTAMEYAKGNGWFSCGGFRWEQQGNTLIFDITVPSELGWSAYDAESIGLNLGTDRIEVSDHYEFWSVD